MDKLTKYVIKEFTSSFITLFSILTLIVSLIYIISISNITSGIKITFLELLKMYFLSLPQIIFISLSISFFIAANSLYAKLSETQEIVALYSLGFKTSKILKPIIFLAIVITILNSLILLISIPYSKIDFINFKNEKKQEANFNFESRQISQKFGQWLVFANKGKKIYQNVFLYNPKENKLITSSNAYLKTKNSVLHFLLTNGTIYDFEKNFIIDYKKMQINKQIPKLHISIFNFKNYFSYNKKLFAKYIPLVFLPIALIFFIPLISFFHPRLHKNRYLIYSLIVLIIYYGSAFNNRNILISFLIPLIFFIIGGILYKWKKNF